MGGRHEGRRTALALGALLAPLISALCAAPLSAVRQSSAHPDDRASIAVSLITTGPGTSIASRFGHAALWIEDAGDGSSVAFSFGRSGLDEPPDVSLLIQGRLPAGGGEEDARELLARYASEGRSIWIQALDLSTTETDRLVEHLTLRRGLGPPYHFFSSNCSTELRDALDLATGGWLRAQTENEFADATLRTWMSGFTATDPLLHTLTNLLLGSRVDRPLTRWDQMYLPSTLRAEIRDIRRTDEAGREVSLVREEEIRPGTLSNQNPKPRSPFMWGYLVAGVALGGMLAALGSLAPGNPAARVGFAVLGGAWTLTCGLLGALMLALWAFSDPSLGQWNANLLLASPLALLLGVVAWGGGSGAADRMALGLALAIVASAALAGGLLLLPGPGQSNGLFIALFLPAHAGLAWGFWRVRASRRVATSPDPTHPR